jgi:hypothetical protein
MIEYVVIITNIVLALLMGLYVVLTYRLVNETKKVTEQNRALFERQFLLSTLPHLHISIGSDKATQAVTVYNSGEMAAYDVDLLIVATYNEDEIDIPTFMVRFVSPDHRRFPPTATDEGFYGVYDHLVYPIFPKKRKVVAKLDTSISPGGIYCLLQFRDVSGTNYSHVYWFYEQEYEEGRIYRLGSIEPNNVTQSPRINFSFSKEKKLLAENKQPIPQYVSKEFSEFWEHSIPCGYTKTASYDVEDRGQWQEL